MKEIWEWSCKKIGVVGVGRGERRLACRKSWLTTSQGCHPLHIGDPITQPLFHQTTAMSTKVIHHSTIASSHPLILLSPPSLKLDLHSTFYTPYVLFLHFMPGGWGGALCKMQVPFLPEFWERSHPRNVRCKFPFFQKETSLKMWDANIFSIRVAASSPLTPLDLHLPPCPLSITLMIMITMHACMVTMAMWRGRRRGG